MNLFVSPDQKCLSSRGLTSEVREPPHRLRGSQRQKERFSGCAVLFCGRPIRQNGDRGAPGGVLVTFSPRKKCPGSGAGSPRKTMLGGGAPDNCAPARPARGESEPVGQMRPPSRWENRQSRPAAGKAVHKKASLSKTGQGCLTLC